LSEENKTSDGLEQSVDGGIDKALAAKGAYDTAQSIGAAASEAGAAAAEGAASAGAGASAAAGTGAAVGTAGGPGGTAMGAIIGLAVGLFAKPLVKGIIVIIVFLVMIFSSLPSMLFEQPKDIADNSGPISIYQQFKDYAMQAYESELEKRKTDIEDDFQKRVNSGEFDEYDHIDMTYSFVPTEGIFLNELREASVLIIAMFEVHTDDWRKATFDQFKSAVNSVNFWNDTIEVVYKEEETEVTTDDDDETTLHIHITYDIFDRGVEQFRSKFALNDEKEYIKAVEMAFNIKTFFGEVAELPMGGISSGGAAGSYPGGGTHNTIRQALAALEEPREFFGGSTIVPLSSYHYISSEFGPRNYAPDPLHTGLDFSADSGTPIYAAMDGIVLLRLTNHSTFGHHIVLYHGDGITTMYAHMNSFGNYQIGDTVNRGDVIGYVGRTGLSTGDHLHFEYQRNGTAYSPRQYLPPV